MYRDHRSNLLPLGSPAAITTSRFMFVKQDVHGEIDQERAGQASSNPAAPAVVQEASKVLRCSPSKTMPTKSISDAF